MNLPPSVSNFLGKASKGFAQEKYVYQPLALYLLLAMGLFSVCRFGFYFFNIGFFPDMSLGRFLSIFLGGLRFDLTAVLYFNALFILLLILPFQYRFYPVFQKILKYLFLLTNGLALATNVADFVYYRYTFRRTDLSVIDQFRNESNWGQLLFHFLIDFWYAVIFWIVLVGVMTYLYNRIRKFRSEHRPNYFTGTVMLIFAGALFIGGVRGGFSGKPPINMINAAEYATVPRDINLVLNTPFTLLKSDASGVVQRLDYFSSADSLAKAFDPVTIPKGKGSFRPENVVVIILESFSKEFVGAYNKNGEKGYTPFIDSLIAHSKAYEYSMANGLRSIEAEPAVICSIPSIQFPYLLSRYAGNKVNSLPNLLKEKGYHTAFFHGASNGSMGFQAFATLCGFDAYYGKNEYNHDEDYDGVWGIWDEKFLQFFAQQMDGFKAPFCTVVHTVSSHHPFNIPQEYTDRFHGGPLPIHKTIEYADYSLRRFFETASRMSWYENTLFVITADHAASWGNFSIPIFFYKPAAGWSSMETIPVSQLDILPTVLGYLNYDKPYVAFGSDVFDRSITPFAFHFLDNNYQAFMGDFILEFNGSKTTALYNFKTDATMKHDIKDQSELVIPLEWRLKGLLQQYNARLIDDNLTADGPLIRASK